MSDPIKVTIPSRGITLKFPKGSNPEQIKEAIDRDYPRDGRDVAYDIGQDPGYAEQMSLKEYEDLRKFKKDNPANADQIWEGVRGLVSTIGSGLEKGGQAVANLDLMNAGEAVGRGVVTGVADLGDVINRITTWNSAPDTYEDFIAGKTNTPERRAEYDAKLKADFIDFKELQGYQAQRKNVVEKSPIPELTEAASVVADPTMLIPGAGEILGASKIAARGVGAVAKGVGEAARVITRPAAEVVERLSTVENPIIRGAAQLATPVTTGVEVADAIARGAVTAGENLVNAPTRIGPLESLGRTANATNVDRALASVGRYGGDKLIQGGLAAATGGVEGAVIGGTLGGLADGEEGFYSGLGAGMVAGAVGGAVGNAYYQLSGQARTDAALADFNRFRSQLDDPTRTKIDKVAERDGLNAVVGLMDGAGVLRGQFKDADVNFLNAEEFKAKHKGADARGVQLIEADRPIIDINVDHKRSDYTFGHEIFHALEQVEQLSPKIERLKQDIVGGFIQNPDGTYTQAQAGFLSPAEIEARHAEYTKKLASSGADASAWVNDANIGQKASRVASELGAEYMARLIAGSDPDAMLRGFDGLTRQIADHALLKMSNETLRGVAERLGTGTKPVESILFGGLKDAPPVVAAALRDVLRARKTMADRIELVDRSDRGLVIKPTDMTNPAAAELAVKAGIAVKDPSGAFRMRTDDEINKLEEVQAQAIKRVVESVPVADPSTPHLRVVDGNIVGGGISPEQAKAFLADPNLSNKVKESLGLIAGSMSNLNSGKGGNVLFIEYGPALRKIKSRITGKFRNAYSSGIRLTQREIAPFSLSFNKGDVPYINTVDVSKLLSKAGDRAAADKLGPYGRDFDGFVTDVVSYFENVSNPSGVRTAELPGMTADKATFLNQFFGSQAKGGAEFVRSFRLDRITEARETGKRVAASELAWQRQKINWLPAENLGDSKIFNSPDSGYRIISKSNNKHSLYAPTGERIGIYDTQAKAEAKANLVLDKSAGDVARNVPVDESLSAGQRGDVGKWISTRKPTAKGAYEDALKQNLVINSDAVIGDPAAQKRVVSLIKDYPGFKSNSKDPQTIINDFKSFVVDNLLYLHDSMDPALRQRAQKWYDGARKISEQWSEKTGFSRDTVAAVLASLSPQTDWFRNVAQAERAINIFKDNQNTVMSPAMDGWLSNYFEGDKDGAKIIDAMRGKKFSDLSTYEKAVWTRAYDQVNNPRDYRILTPEGSFADLVRKQDGSPAAMGWGNFKTLSNAMSVLENPSRANISERLGGEHKVRSFYNNILLPDLKAFGDVTIDTHAVAAGLLRPLAGADTEVSHNLGAGISSATTGASGIYGIYADAYRDAAKQRGILPRQMQSITWEAVRGLFTAEWKTKANKELVNKIWNEYKKGNLTKDEARLQISKAADGIKTPDWARSDSRATEQTQDRGNTRELPEADVRGNSIATVDSRGRANASTKSKKNVNNFQPAAPDTPAFNQWSGGLPVIQGNAKIPDSGAVLRVYHGSPDVRGIFKDGFKGSRYSGDTFFAAADYDVANSYADDTRAFDYQNAEPQVIPLFVKLKNPLVVDAKGKHWRETESAIDKAKRGGYDGLVIRNSIDYYNKSDNQKPTTVVAWFNNTQAKSDLSSPMLSRIDKKPISGAVPNTSFSLTDPRISFQPAEKLPNGQAWSTNNKYRVIQKDGGKFRVYAPTGAMIGVADTLDKSKKLIEKRSR
jgi:hypothetical protein